MKKIIIAVMFCSSLAIASDLKIAVVNVQEVFSKCDAGKGVISLSKELEAKIKIKGAEIDGMGDDKSKESKDQALADLQRMQESSKDAVQKALDSVNEKILRAIDKIKKRDHYLLILKSDQVVKFDDSIDITNEVIEEMEK